MSEPIENGDSFMVKARYGDATRTVGYTGTARINGVTFSWLAGASEGGFRLDARPVGGGTWNAETREWRLSDDSTIPGASVAAVLEGLGKVLNEATARADEAAGRAHEEALTEMLGEIDTQRALFL